MYLIRESLSRSRRVRVGRGYLFLCIREGVDHVRDVVGLLVVAIVRLRLRPRSAFGLKLWYALRRREASVVFTMVLLGSVLKMLFQDFDLIYDILNLRLGEERILMEIFTKDIGVRYFYLCFILFEEST